MNFFTVNFGLTSVQLLNQTADQAVQSEVNDESKTRENLQNLFDSITNNDTRRSGIYGEVLKQEAERERQAFDSMKVELQIAQNRNAYKRKNFYHNHGSMYEAVPSTQGLPSKGDLFDDIAEEKKRIPRKTRPPNCTELFDAIEKDNQKLVKELLEEGEEEVTLKSTINENNETAVHIATQYGNLDLLSYLLKKDYTLLEAKDKWGQTILIVAAKKGYVHIIKYLIDELRVDLNLSKYRLKGNTPIHVAAEEGHLNVIKWYCEDFKHTRGNPNLQNSLGETLAMSAVKRGQRHVLEYVLEDGLGDPLIINHHDENVLFYTAVTGNVDISRYLLEEMCINFDVDMKNMFGMTPLFMATRFNHYDSVEYFVERRNATIDLTNNMGWTPLHEAACEGHFDIVRYLVERKADPMKKEMQGRTPAQVAKKNNIIKYLQAEMLKRADKTTPN